MSFNYHRRVVKRRPASLTDSEWSSLFELGKLPRPYFRVRDGGDHPPADVYDLVYARELNDLRWRLEVLCMALVRPNVAASGTPVSSSTLTRGALLIDFSELWGFLTDATYQDGTPRSTGQLSLKLSAGKLQVTLTDPTSSTYCCQSGSSLDDVFLALEIGLKDGSLPWRPSGFSKGKK